MKALVVDDSAMSRRMLEMSLTNWGYDVTCAEDGKQALEALCASDGPRIALLDWMMPVMDGLTMCRKLRAVENLPYCYVIMLTAKDGRADIAEALRGGADDYVTKPWDPVELQARVDVGRRMIELHVAIEESNRRLTEAARTDFLTGALSRTGLMARFEEECARAAREHSPLAVEMIDVDHFKKVNDVYGHVAGDAVLKGIAQRVRETCRPYDTLGRFGGEEFLVLVPGIPFDAVRDHAERHRLNIMKTPIDTDDADVAVTVSVGVLWHPGGTMQTVSKLVGAADAQLYKAKNAGRNRTEVAPWAE